MTEQDVLNRKRGQLKELIEEMRTKGKAVDSSKVDDMDEQGLDSSILNYQSWLNDIQNFDSI